MGEAARDSYVLTHLGGSTYDLASHVDLTEGGPDFGDAAMDSHYAVNPAADGGRFSFESIGPRTFRFPLLVPSSPSGIDYRLSLYQLAARPGAYIDLTLMGQDAAQPAVRFEIAGAGRWKPDYHLRHQAVGVRRGMFEFDVQPFGHWPTEIILASVASVGLPGKLTIPGGSVIGDVPGLGHLYVSLPGNLPTNYPAGTWRADFMAWSLGARPSFQAQWIAASLTSGAGFTASLAGDAFAPASQGLQIIPSQNLNAWKMAANTTFQTALEPAYRGRYRLFTWAKLGPSQALPWYVSGDNAAYFSQALASAAPIATLAPAVASGSPGAYGAQPSPAYTLLDLGEIALPQHGSGATAADTIRLWISPATSNVGVATTTITFGGLYLHPVDGAGGVIPRGIVVPTTGATGAYETPNVRVDAIRERVILDPGPPAADLLSNYRGNFPIIGASVQQVDLLIGERAVGVNATGPVVRAFNERNSGAGFSLTYRPRFTFQRGI